MKVAIAFPGCHRRGGVERVMLECGNYLAARGHETHCYAIDWDAESIDPRVNQHQLTVSSRNYIGRLFGFIRASRREIGLLSPPPDALAGFGIESPENSVIWMQSVHRAWLDISSRERNLRGRMKQKLNPAHAVILALERSRFTKRKYRKVIALTPRVKDDIMRLYGVPDSDIVVIPNGYSPSEFSILNRAQNRARVRSRIGLADADRVVIFVANELERKGFYPLLQALVKLNDPGLHLLAVGRLNPETYRQEIETCRMANRVHWTGPTNCVAEYYAAADVFALPTQYEAWGLVIVEAMACGLPVVTSRLAGASAAVRENETGVLLNHPHDPAEIAGALAPLLSGSRPDPGAVSESVARYRWDTVLKSYETVLGSTL